MIHDLELNVYELYNLKNDIGETKNIARSLAEKTAILKAILDNWVTKNYYKKLELNPKWNRSNLK